MASSFLRECSLDVDMAVVGVIFLIMVETEFQSPGNLLLIYAVALSVMPLPLLCDYAFPLLFFSDPVNVMAPEDSVLGSRLFSSL